MSRQRCFCCGEMAYGCQRLPDDLRGDKTTLYCQPCIELIRKHQAEEREP